MIGQAVVRIALTGSIGADLFRSIVALVFLLVLIGFVLDAIASVREADRSRQELS
jgi:cell division protein FtsL